MAITARLYETPQHSDEAAYPPNSCHFQVPQYGLPLESRLGGILELPRHHFPGWLGFIAFAEILVLHATLTDHEGPPVEHEVPNPFVGIRTFT